MCNLEMFSMEHAYMFVVCMCAQICILLQYVTLVDGLSRLRIFFPTGHCTFIKIKTCAGFISITEVSCH